MKIFNLETETILTPNQPKIDVLLTLWLFGLSSHCSSAIFLSRSLSFLFTCFLAILLPCYITTLLSHFSYSLATMLSCYLVILLHAILFEYFLVCIFIVTCKTTRFLLCKHHLCKHRQPQICPKIRHHLSTISSFGAIFTVYFYFYHLKMIFCLSSHLLLVITGSIF